MCVESFSFNVSSFSFNVSNTFLNGDGCGFGFEDGNGIGGFADNLGECYCEVSWYGDGFDDLMVSWQ